MSDRLNFDFHFTKGQSENSNQRDAERPCRVLVMSDLGGRGANPDNERDSVVDWQPRRIDIDNFDKIFTRTDPRLRLSIGNNVQPVVVQLSRLDSFHPDELYRKLDVFRALSKIRQGLLTPDTFATAVAELTQFAQTATVEAAPAEEVQTKPSTPEEDAAMFERLLGEQTKQSGTSTGTQHQGLGFDISKLIKEIAAPHSIPRVDPHLDTYMALVDEAISDLMRQILHAPEFQSLEASWLALHSLVFGLELGEELQVYVLNITKQQLRADIAAAGDQLDSSQLYRRLVEETIQTLGGEPWSLIVGDYRFGTSQSDLTLLAACGAIAAQAGGPFLAQAKPDILGCSSLADQPDSSSWQPLDHEAEQRWMALRRSRVANWIGLTLPRVLLRLPYGKETDEIESFQFNELPQRKHESYLWGNPAFACARLLCTGFQEQGWSMQTGRHLDLTDLPAHTYREDGETKLQPCAEVLLADRVRDVILDRGIMPLLSWKDRDQVRLARFQSIADPPAAISGPWQ